MPIYEYRCASCGYQNDYLQKLSEPPLTDCPECGKATFAKQVTAAGFQLKGSGWYATDFKNNGTGKGAGKKDEGKGESGAKKDDAKGKSEGEGGKADAGGTSSGGSSDAVPAPGAGASPA
jgi:putative FmdB family regulatory protein